MSMLSLPNELLLNIAENLLERPKHIHSLLLSNRRLAYLLTPLLHTLAVQDKDGWTALQWAAKHGYEPLAEIVLLKGAKVNAVSDSFNESALHLAVKNRHVGLIGILLANGAGFSEDPGSRQMALNLAAREGRDDVVQLLLKSGADEDVKRGALVYGATALHWAASGGHGTVVRILLENGADVGVQASYGGGAIDWAKQEGHDDIFRVLLGMGAVCSVPNWRCGKILQFF